MNKKRVSILLLTLFSIFGCSPKQESHQSSKQNGFEKTGKEIVVYFSLTNNTKKIADYIVEITNCDTYEITAKEPYTAEDTKYDTNTRAYKEQKDPNSRPEIASEQIDLSVYETIYLGYPIWHGQAPKIMHTFMELYDFEAKIILPFCTSESSPLGSSAVNLSSCASKATWKEGIRFSKESTKEDVQNWIRSTKE